MTDLFRFAADPVPGTPSAESVRLARRVAGSRRFQERQRPQGFQLWLMRTSMRSMGLVMPLPAKGTAKSVRFGNGVRGRYVAGPHADPAGGILLWLHGGGLVAGTPRLEEGLALVYAEKAKIPAFLPRYRLAPEHPFPAAPDDVLAAYRCLLDQGFAAEKIRLGAMSAGGALAAGLLGDLRRAGLPMPGAVLLVSPLLELDCELMLARDSVAPDPTLAPETVRRWNRAFAGATPFTDPRLDLLGADLTGRPPTLIQAGGLECLTTACTRYGEAMAAAGAPCEVQVWPGQVHGFPGMGYRKVPEAKAAVAYGAEFLAGA